MALRLEAGTAGCWLSVITKGSVAAGWPLGTPLRYSDGKFGQVISLTPFRGIPLGALLRVLKIGLVPGRCPRLSSTVCLLGILYREAVPPPCRLSMCLRQSSIGQWGPSVDDGDPFQIWRSITAVSPSMTPSSTAQPQGRWPASLLQG